MLCFRAPICALQRYAFNQELPTMGLYICLIMFSNREYYILAKPHEMLRAVVKHFNLKHLNELITMQLVMH